MNKRSLKIGIGAGALALSSLGGFALLQDAGAQTDPTTTAAASATTRTADPAQGAPTGQAPTGPSGAQADDGPGRGAQGGPAGDHGPGRGPGHARRPELTDEQKQCLEDEGITPPAEGEKRSGPPTEEQRTAMDAAAKKCGLPARPAGCDRDGDGQGPDGKTPADQAPDGQTAPGQAPTAPSTTAAS